MSLPFGNVGGYAQVAVQDDDVNRADPSLQQNLVGPAAGSALPSAASIPMMQVVAPATLPEGYKFEATMGNNKFMVTVPAGGVEEGQTFTVTMPSSLESRMVGVSIPVGHWRDEIFECFHYGVCHAHCWTSWLCTLLAAGQVIHRLKFNWYGSPANSTAQSSGAFSIIFMIVVGYFAIHFTLYLCVLVLAPYVMNHYGYDASTGKYLVSPPGYYLTLQFWYSTLHWIYLLFIVAVVANLRRNVRQKYAIPAPDLEDCCCAFWCHCCVTAQLLRHTTDYELYPAILCTPTGLPDNVPLIV